MDKRRGKTKRERKRKEEEEKRKREEKKKIKKGILDIYNLNLTGEAVLPNVFQNASSSTKEAAPPKKPEPELSLEGWSR